MFFPIFGCFALIVSVLCVSVYKSTNIYSFFAEIFAFSVGEGTKKAPPMVDGAVNVFGGLWFHAICRLRPRLVDARARRAALMSAMKGLSAASKSP